MFEIKIEHPDIEDRTYFADRQGELRNIVWAVARAQGKPIANDREMIATVGDVGSQCLIKGEATLKVHDVTVTLREPEGCEGHPDDDSVLLGGPEFCDGTCKPRPRFTLASAADLSCALDDAELEASGGCGRCSLEADQMCAGCGKCNCHTHETCVRPADEAQAPQGS